MERRASRNPLFMQQASKSPALFTADKTVVSTRYFHLFI